jgi:8-oxo-dGTP diphosphatase
MSSAAEHGDEPAIRVLAAVIERNSQFLLCLRPQHKRHGGMWEFPGGKLEPGESLHHAAARELLEELGVTVTRVGRVLLSRHDQGSPYLIEFTEVAISGEPRALEHDEVRWLAPADALALRLAPADRAFAEEIWGLGGLGGLG